MTRLSGKTGARPTSQWSSGICVFSGLRVRFVAVRDARAPIAGLLSYDGLTRSRLQRGALHAACTSMNKSNYGAGSPARSGQDQRHPQRSFGVHAGSRIRAGTR
eukprot:4524102-Pyramimonas_sp.AAC.1